MTYLKGIWLPLLYNFSTVANRIKVGCTFVHIDYHSRGGTEMQLSWLKQQFSFYSVLSVLSGC